MLSFVPYLFCGGDLMTDKKQWGGRRPNQTGRPKGTIKPEGVRSQHQLRAYDEEWDLIRRFARLVKHGKTSRTIEKMRRVVLNYHPTVLLLVKEDDNHEENPKSTR